MLLTFFKKLKSDDLLMFVDFITLFLT